eukprot:g736.t1
MNPKSSRFANRRKVSIYENSPTSRVARRKNLRTGSQQGYATSKRISQFQGEHRYSLQHGREASKHRDKSKTDSRNNVVSSSVQVIFEHDEDLSSDDSSDAEYMYDNFEDHEIDSDEEEKKAMRTEDGKEISRCKNEISVYVTVDDDHPDGSMPPILVHCGNGENTFKWLSVVAMSRYSALSKSSGRLRSREHFHVKRGSYMPLVVAGNTAKWPPSRYIAPEMKISSVLQHEDPVTIKLNANGTPDILIDGRLQTRTSMLDTHTMYLCSCGVANIVAIYNFMGICCS